jgi:glycosyltransferase involved in cell wall biosynthesis
MKTDVVICVKNNEKGLENILRQVKVEIPFEKLIVVYATSEDKTRLVAEKYTENVFWDEDKGLGAARKLGVLKSTSDIVAMIDSDVILTEGWYEQLIGFFQDSKVAAVMGTCIYGYGNKPLQAYWEYVRSNAKVFWGCQNTMFRRESVLKVGNFKQEIKGAGEDYDLYLRLIKAGCKWLWVRNASVYHPMKMFEYLKHVSWWTQGRPYLDEVEQWIIDTSALRFYGRQVFFVIESFWEGAKLSIAVHPFFILYWPLIRISSELGLLRRLKLHRAQKIA